MATSFRSNAATKGFFNLNSGPNLGYSIGPSVNHVALNGQATNADRPTAKGGASWTLQPNMQRPIGPTHVVVVAAAFRELGQGALMGPQLCVRLSQIPNFSRSKFSSENT
ncbi:hypothetical protein GOBAR_DD22031 [Gossypium barbadense]|nr:hypothetical protein GOBAR_DD22031 [Gossypium barbadense]